MVKNILKIVGAVLGGLFVGLFIGVALGLVFGFVISLFFQEIVYLHQTILMSILLSVILGGLLVLISVKMLNSFLDTEDKPFGGIAAGVVVAVVVALFIYGFVDIPDLSVFEQSFYSIPLFYSVSVGGQIGAILCPILGIIATIRSIIRLQKEEKELEEEAKNRFSFYNSSGFEKDR